MGRRPRKYFWRGLWVAAGAIGWALTANAQAQGLSGEALIEALRQGGYVLLMRHASSPSAAPEPSAAEVDNTARERQLDNTGRTTAMAMGGALKALRIPVGRVLSSPTYRALQTAKFAALPAPLAFSELGDGGQSMQAATTSQSAWLRGKIADPPPRGTDTIIITHFPNIQAAYGDEAAGLADGEALIFHPDGKGGAQLRGRVKIEAWPSLAAGR